METKNSFDIDDIDDSSDEEDGQKVAENLITCFKKYEEGINKTNYAVDKFIKEEDKQRNSFKVFNIAVNYLYSPTVNNIYYPKKKLLKKSVCYFEQQKLHDYFIGILKNRIKDFFIIDLQKKITENLYIQFWQDYEAEIKQFITEYWTKTKLRFYLKKEQGTAKQDILNNFSYEILKKALLFIEKANILQEIEKSPPLMINDFSGKIFAMLKVLCEEQKIIDNSGKFNQSTKNIKSEIEEYIKTQNPDEIKTVFLNHIFLKPKKGTYPSYSSILFYSLLDLEKNYLEKENSSYRLKMTTTKEQLSDCIISFLFKDKNEWDNNLNGYLPYTIEKIKQEIILKLNSKKFSDTTNYFNSDDVDRLFSLERGVFAPQNRLETTNIVDFIANIRLAMRVQRRRIRQFKDNNSELFDGEEFQLAWKFYNLDSLVLETQEITKNYGRNDKVQNLSTYAVIYSKLEQFKKSIGYDLDKLKLQFIVNIDECIALWLRGLLNKGKLIDINFQNQTFILKFDELANLTKYKTEFVKFLTNVAYLLFGCEVQRNQSALIIHQMGIDLIAAGELTWQQAITDPQYYDNCGGGLLPMTMGTYKKPKENEEKSQKVSALPVQTARLFQNRYSTFSVKKWTYEGEDASPTANSSLNHNKEFIKREATIINMWLKLRSKNNTSNQPINLEHEIQLAFENEWYPAQWQLNNKNNEQEKIVSKENNETEGNIGFNSSFSNNSN